MVSPEGGSEMKGCRDGVIQTSLISPTKRPSNTIFYAFYESKSIFCAHALLNKLLYIRKVWVTLSISVSQQNCYLNSAVRRKKHPSPEQVDLNINN